MRQFCELLPKIKGEFDSFEGEVEEFETIGTDSAVLDQVASNSARLEGLEYDIGGILDVEKVHHFASPV